MNFEDKIKLNIFNGPTTYLDDYRKYHGLYRVKPVRSREKFERPKFRTKPLGPSMDRETYSPLKKKIPFDLTIVPNEVTRGNPQAEFGNTPLPEDVMKEEVIKTRPRVYCSPQVSMDDVPDPEMKQLLLDYTYTSDWRKAELEFLSMIDIEYRETPNTVLEHDRFLEKTRKHYFSVKYNPKPLLLPEMTRQQNIRGEKWTNEQLVGATHATELFWENKDVKCGACHDPLMNLVDKKTKQKINDLMEQNWLRIPHDKQCPGYGGFLPEIAVGMGLSKIDLPCAHPIMSTNQVVERRKIKDSDIPKFDE